MEFTLTHIILQDVEGNVIGTFLGYNSKISGNFLRMLEIPDILGGGG